MHTIALSQRTSGRLTASEWAYAVEQYELGFQSGASIARRMKVSQQAISSGLKKRKAVKGIRAQENVVSLNKYFDLRDAEKRRVTAELWDASLVQVRLIKGLIYNIMISINEPVLA